MRSRTVIHREPVLELLFHTRHVLHETAPSHRGQKVFHDNSRRYAFSQDKTHAVPAPLMDYAQQNSVDTRISVVQS